MSGSRPSALTGEQRRAIDARDLDLLLEAGAGTGKTTVLVERYCDLIAKNGLSPDEILAFTFTDRAAAQLRERVRRELERRAEVAEGAAAQQLREIVAGIGGSWITTIHGFCRRLLANHPVAAGIDPRFRVLDAAEAERAARAAFDAALEDFLAAGDPERETTVAAYRVTGLRDLVTGLHDELRSRGEDPPRLPVPPHEDLGDALERAEAALHEARDAGGRAGAKQQAKMDAALVCLGEGGPATPSAAELADLCFDSAPAAGPRLDYHEAISEAARIRAQEELGPELREHLEELLEFFGTRYTEAKARRGGLDFEDLQLGALRLLLDSEPIRASYASRFSHLMVDEFQDTNRLQLELVRALRGPRTSLFIVGDEFQSIYGFRHADIDVFRGERARLEEGTGSEVLPLSGNFRSRPPIIAAANRIGAGMLPEFRPLSAGRPRPDDAGPQPDVELLLTPGDGWDEEGIDLQLPVDDATRPRFVAEARFLAARLRALADADGGYAPGEMVLLLRAFTRVDAFEEALERAGLRPYVIGGRGYWSQQQVEDLRCLLETIANPLEDERLLGALSSPACGVSPDTMWLLRQATGRNRHLWPGLEHAVGAGEMELEAPEMLAEIAESEMERLKRFHDQISGLRETGSRLGLEELVDRAITDTGYDLAVLGRRSGRLRMANLRKMMRLAREYEAREGRDLRGFLDFAELRAGVNDEAAAATESEDHDGVRVMTIHNAKGLEFGVVAVAGLGRRLLEGGAWAPDARIGREPPEQRRLGLRVRRLGAKSLPIYAMKELHEEENLRSIAEELRLFYVAATRAENHLILSGTLEGERPDEMLPEKGTPVAWRLLDAFGISEPVDGTEAVLPGPLRIDGTTESDATVAVRLNEASVERAAELVRAGEHDPPTPPPLAGTPPIVTLEAPAAAVGALSYSALGEFSRCGYRFEIERVLGLRTPVVRVAEPGDPPVLDDRGRFGFGTAIHSLLEWSARNRWLEPQPERVREALRESFADPDEGAERRAREMVEGWIGSDLRAELAAGGIIAEPESPFLIGLGGSVVRGSIDLLARPRDGGTPTVVDYKTDGLRDDDPAERAKRYETQRDLYALAVSEATGAESVRVAYVFLERPAEPVLAELGPEEIAAARVRIEGLIASIRAGDFTATEDRDWALCGDCPARGHLCAGPAREEDSAAAPA